MLNNVKKVKKAVSSGSPFPEFMLCETVTSVFRDQDTAISQHTLLFV
jgi:hypothetical protein